MKIEDYGYLSDLETGALVGRNGSIDWYCVPRFDSPACFTRLLGTEENGFWRIGLRGSGMAARRRYRDNALILESEFESPEGCVRLTDFLAKREGGPRLFRRVEGLRGRVSMEMELRIRYDYGAVRPWVRSREDALIATGGPHAMVLYGRQPTEISRERSGLDFEIAAGETLAWELAWHPSHEEVPDAEDAGRVLEQTERFWRDWAAQFSYRGAWDAAVARSSLVLKGLTYAPTGGILAAATMGLPERIGGRRNWDYRYCWLRDAGLTLDALLDAGYQQEARAWRDWLMRAVGGSPNRTQIVYGLAGERRMPEFELTHLSGYENSRPILVGNEAAHQFQLDIYGQVLDTIYESREAGIPANEDSWKMQKELVEFVADHWREADNGLWEVRTERRHFTHSKIMAWVALDRAVKSCERHGMDGDLERWKAVREQIHRDVCERGYNTRIESFTMDSSREYLDASLLVIPMVGFLPAQDERVSKTIAAIEKKLLRKGFVYRYDPEEAENVDGLPCGEGAFLPCSFWMAEAMHMQGRSAEARELFERLLAVRNDLGLLSEEYDPEEGRLLGNFPQAFSHVGLINAAYNLNRPNETHKRKES